MKSVVRRIRKEFAPLNSACVLVCISQDSAPTTQVLVNGLFDPDRSLTPTVILPMVSLATEDGSWKQANGNPLLAEMQWYVNDQPISLSDWVAETDYTVNNSSTANRGAITIFKNIDPASRVKLSFRAVIADPRMGDRVPILSDDIWLSTVDKADDDYAISIGETNLIQYNPFLDKLLVYEHEVAMGIRAENAADRAAATDQNCYLRSIPISVFRGKEEVATGYALKLFRIGAQLALTEMVEGEDELLSFTLTELLLDLRLVEKSDYQLNVYNLSNTLVATLQFSVERIHQRYHITPANGTDIHPSDKVVTNVALVDSNGKVVPYPDLLLDIVWKTTTSASADVVHNEGERAAIVLNKTGIGDTQQDSWMDVYTESEHKAVNTQALDSSNVFYVDENGDYLII